MSEPRETGRTGRRLLVRSEEPWSRVLYDEGPSRPDRALQGLGSDDGAFLQAIISGALGPGREEDELRPFRLPEGSQLFQIGPGDNVLVPEVIEDDATSREDVSQGSTLSMYDAEDFPSTLTELEALDSFLDGEVGTLVEVDEAGSGLEADRPGTSGQDFSPSAPPLADLRARDKRTVRSSLRDVEPPREPTRTQSSAHQTWRRRSMQRLRHIRLADPPSPVASRAQSQPASPAGEQEPASEPQASPAVQPPASPVQEDPGSEEECGDMGGSPLGQWPHRLSSMMACLACTLGIFNISRFAVLSVQFGANFVLQFIVMSLVLGIPLFTFHVSLGQLLGSGAMDMWRISPIFQGIGIALILSQALLGIYSIVGVSWMFIYFRDSFITKQDTYRWSVPYEGFEGFNWRSNSTVKLEETVANYFSAVVLQRSNLETPANAPGHLKFQVTFNLAVVWMIVFISLSKGLKSYGKVVFLFSLAPAFGMLVLCTKLLGLSPNGHKLQIGFPQTEWSEFFVNSKSWAAAMSEAFYTWGLLGAAAMQMASHNRPKHLLHRDTSFVSTITIAVLVLAAFLANTCSQILNSYGYQYVPSSFEKMSTYGFLHPKKAPLPASLASTPVRWLPRSLLLAGDKVLKPAVNTRQQSGYQALRLATELVPATLAVLGPGKLSPFWSVLFYFVLILFGIAQQLAIMHCVITGIMAIKVKSLKSWETTITFFTCVCGFILGLPMATELGIFVVYFLDYTVGGGWWIMLLYLAELVAVFMVRGRPYSGETVVATLFAHAGRCLQDWAAPVLSFTWNVILPVLLMILCISVFKSGNYRELIRIGGNLNYDYWPPWSRQIGALMQLIPLLAVPFIGVIQSCRYLSTGPPDVFDRIQLLYRPTEDAMSPSGDGSEPISEPEAGNNTSSTPPTTIVEDPPPKYTPPPSYSTATGARIAKMMRQSFRRSVRRIQTAFGGGSGEGTSSTTDIASAEEPPPPDYEAVLVEIHNSLSPQGPEVSIPVAATTSQAASALATVSEVASRLRSSFRRAMSSQSQQSLVPAASPIHRDSLILDDKRIE